MRIIAFLFTASVLSFGLVAPAAADTMAETCAEHPDWAGCQEDFPDTLEETCAQHPDWEGCRDDGLQGGPVLPSNPNTGTDDGLTGAPILPSEPEEEETDRVKIIDEFLDGYEDDVPGGELGEEEESNPLDLTDPEELELDREDEEAAEDFIEDLLDEVDGELDDLEQEDRDCANLARLRSLSERLDFQIAATEARYAELEEIEEVDGREYRSRLQPEYQDVQSAIADVERERAELNARGEPIPNSIDDRTRFLQDRSRFLRSQMDAPMPTIYGNTDVAMSRALAQLEALTDRKFMTDLEIGDSQLDCD